MLPEILNTTADCSIISERTVNFPQQLVYDAWAKPQHLKNWWGPAGLTNTFIEHDLRPGGRWQFIMHGPDKGNYPNECVFIKVEAPSLLAWYRISKPHFQVVAVFEDAGNHNTHVTFKMLFATAEECEKLKKFVVDKNEENLDRLEAELATMTL